MKDVVDSGLAAGFDWSQHAIKLVLAGEVFSEEWRDLLARRLGMGDPVYDSASLYGTADAGVLGNETPLSILIRRFFAGRPDLVRELFGDSRLPTLVQYDPSSRFFEDQDGTLLFSGDSGVPLIRYHIADQGGLVSSTDMQDYCARHGFTPKFDNNLPFVFVFGRSLRRVVFRRKHLPRKRDGRPGATRNQRVGDRQIRTRDGYRRGPEHPATSNRRIGT